jgi:hypothetical protein
MGGSHHFGCVSMRKPEYCILNKQYTKEEYEKLHTHIVEDMNKNPYISVDGHTYRYGEFFPPEFSPLHIMTVLPQDFFHSQKNKLLEKV